MNYNIPVITLLALLLNGPIYLAAQSPPSLFDRLEEQAVLDIQLTTDWTVLLQDSIHPDEYLQGGTMSFEQADGSLVELGFSVKERGKYRRRVCDFPPLKLNFSKKQLRALGLAGDFDKYKLVTHCSSNRFEGKEAVLREYLTYQMFREFTDRSYRVHLLRIKYEDTHLNGTSFTRFAFLIESSKQLEERLQADKCDDCLLPAPDSLFLEDENRMALFQYWIGNADYSIPIGRNVHLFKHRTTNRLIPVPYDFDFAGTVAAPYAVPNVELGQRQVGDRIFLGLPVPDEMMTAHLASLDALHDPIDRLIRKQRHLSHAAKLEMRTYLFDFRGQLQTIHGNTAEPKYTQLKAAQPTAMPIGSLPEHYQIAR